MPVDLYVGGAPKTPVRAMPLQRLLAQGAVDRGHVSTAADVPEAWFVEQG